MGNHRTITLGAAIAALCPALCAPIATAATGAGGTAMTRLWATVNVCDTVDHPDAIGIRGAMSGNGDRTQRMFMRFQVQYYDRDAGRWRATGANGDSGFIDVGAAYYRLRQAGRTFTVTAPPVSGQGFRLRGMVTFEWRKDGEVVRRARRRTTGNHPNTRGADPVGFSAGSCVVR